MKVIEKKLSEIKPYKNNPRLNGTAVEGVAESIKQFGFKQPIVIDKDNVIVCGHTRAQAAKKLKLKTVPCVVAEDLTEEQVKAYRLADNKTAEFALWDDEKLFEELESIADIDMSDFGFDLDDLEFNEDTSEKDPDTSPDDEGYYGDERERTFNSTNLLDFDEERASGFYQMPVLRAEKHIPKDLISFNYVLNTDAFDKGVHFYIDDYQFERVWKDPHKYMDRLKQFDCMLTPDFSLYMEMPKAMQIWNIYRSRLIGQIAQDVGIKVIPTLSWSDPGSFKFCFDGIEPGGVVSVSTIGVKTDKDAMKVWTAGMDEAIKKLTPSCVIVYGGDIGYKFPCKVVYIENHNTEKIKENTKNKAGE